MLLRLGAAASRGFLPFDRLYLPQRVHDLRASRALDGEEVG
jgi:hypothetical protein